MADVSLPGRPASASVAATIPIVRPGAQSWIVAGVAMTLLLLGPALWNGFPLIFPDTGGYLARPFEGTLTIGRSALYGLFLYAGIPLAFWPNVILQAALTVWLIVLSLRALGRGGRPWLALGIIAALSVATSLPWFAGQLMPDIFFPVALLALYLLAFRTAQLAVWERIALTAVIAFAMPTHMALAGLCVGLVVTLWIAGKLTRRAWSKPKLMPAAAAVAAGIALCPLSNLAVTGSFAFTPGGESFLFARLLEDGIVIRYLNDRCPNPELRLCAYRSTLPDDADRWLWGDSPFYTLGGWRDYAAEERTIILDTLARYPLMHAETAFAAARAQFTAFATEVSIADNEPTIDYLAELTPQLISSFMGARQQSEPFDVAPLNRLHEPVAALSIAALVLALLLRRRLRLAPELAALGLTILLALAINATICGVFSNVVDRYQSRLVPLAPFAVLLMIARRGEDKSARPLGASAGSP